MTTTSIGSALADAQLRNQDIQSRIPGTVAWLHFGDLHITRRDEQNFRDFRELICHANRCLQGAVDFAILPGDNAEDGNDEQYRLVREAIDDLSLPWHAIAGDHDFKTGSLQLFQKYLRPDLYHSFDLDRYHFIFLNALGTGKHGRFGLGSDQMTWLSADLRKASRRSRASVLFLHCYPGELTDANPRLVDLIQQHDVLMVDMGHTHYNEIANDGRVIYAATRSTGQIEEGPVGFSISVLDQGVVSWKFKSLSEWPFVMITSPADERFITRPGEASQVVREELDIHALVWDEQEITSVTCRIDDSITHSMTRAGRVGRSLWSAHVSSGSVADGVHTLTVTAKNAAGVLCHDAIRICVSRSGDYVLPLRHIRDEANALGAYPDKGILGTQLGPNKNGRKW
jgi:Icc protein